MTTSTPPVDAQRGSTMLSRLAATVAQDPQRIFLTDPISGEQWTRADFIERASVLAAALTRQGLQGQALGMLLADRREYFLIDTAALIASAIPVSLYPTASPAQIAHYITDANLQALFVEHARLQTLEQALSLIPEHRISVVVLDAPTNFASNPRSATRFEDFCLSSDCPLNFAERAAQCQPDELATIIYTSGTTGNAKGACLTHRNFVAAVASVSSGLDLREGDRIISWLPHAHVAERTCHYYGALLLGLEVTFCGDATQLPGLLRQVQPTWFGSIPRFWEKLKAGALAQLSQLPAEKLAMFHTALADGLAMHHAREAGETPSPELAARHQQFEQVFFAPLRQALGLSQARSVHTGSAPTPRNVLEFFASIGLPLRQIYGSTETCMCGAGENAQASRMGSIGKPSPGVAVRIAADGEILLQGLPVMQGYWKHPDATREVLSADGWYASGDLGHLDDDGFVWITGRKKDLIITSSGQNMSPQSIESTLGEQSPLIANVIAVGDGRPYVTALIVLNPERPSTAPSGSELEAHMRQVVAQANAQLARVEQIKRFRILDAQWMPGSDEMTPTMKLRRAVILKKYQPLIEEMYDAAMQPAILEPH